LLATSGVWCPPPSLRSRLSCNTRDAKITFNSFVYRLRFCAASIVLRRIGHLPDTRPAQSLPFLGAVIHDPHITWVESWRQFEQCFPHVVRAGHGSELYRDDYFGYCDGAEIRKEPPSSILLPCRGCGDSHGYHCDYALDPMTSLNPFADDEPPLPNSARYEPGIWKRESRSDGNPGAGRIPQSLGPCLFHRYPHHHK